VDLAEQPWPHGSRLVAELVFDHFRPGAVPVAAQAAPEPEKAPPLEDLEEQLGDLADGLEWPEEPDHSRPGDVGDTYPLPPLPDDAEGPKTHAVSAGIDDTVRRVHWKEAPACGETFHLHASYFTRVGAGGVDFRAMVRAAILHGIAEAYRVCQPTRCERPLLKVLHACWGSGATEASAHVVLETTCTAL
jgi:hypothetical protein